MKTKYIFLFLVSILALSCENEKVVAPLAEYNIQKYEPKTNEWTNLDKPYTISLQESIDNKWTYRVLSGNNSEYNAFYLGDSIYSNKIWIKHIYSPVPKLDYRGLPLVLDNTLNKGLVAISYSIPSTYQVTFVASANGNYGNDMAFSVNSNESIIVNP